MLFMAPRHRGSRSRSRGVTPRAVGPVAPVPCAARWPRDPGLCRCSSAGETSLSKKTRNGGDCGPNPMSVVRTKPITDIGWSAPTLAYGAPARTPRTAQGPRATPTATRTRRHESSHYLRQSTRYTCVHADDRCRYMLYMLTRAGLYSTRLLPRCHLID